MAFPETDRTLALAGLFQAAYLVKQYALTGQIDEEALKASISSVFKIDAENVPSIFGGAHRLQLGLFQLAEFGRKKAAGKENYLLRYVLHMTNVAKKLLKDRDLFQQLQRRLEPAISQAAHFSPDHSFILNNLATIYSRTILEKGYRIPVIGRIDLLQQTAATEKIRALLLAGIRAGVLWYQVGGNRWQLFFSRTKISERANALLNPQRMSHSFEVR